MPVVTMKKEDAYKSIAEYHKILNLILSYFTGMVDHRIGPLNDCIMGTCHVTVLIWQEAKQ